MTKDSKEIADHISEERSSVNDKLSTDVEGCCKLIRAYLNLITGRMIAVVPESIFGKDIRCGFRNPDATGVRRCFSAFLYQTNRQKLAGFSKGFQLIAYHKTFIAAYVENRKTW